MSGQVTIRPEGRGEVRVLGAAVAVLLVLAYLSWTRKETKVTEEKVTITDTSADQLEGITMITRTQTVAAERRKLAKGEPLPYFTVEGGARKRSFVGNKSTKDLFASFAPFVALRGLGPGLTADQLKEVKLDHPSGKLVVRTKAGDKTFEIGGRSYGARDWYLRPVGSKEVYLVASRVLSDLEFPEGRFMQRKLRELESKDVSSAVLKAGQKEKRMLHQNRLSEKDAYWADSAAPDARNETIENYLSKLDGLTASTYLEPDAVKDATQVLEVSWYEDESPKETMTLYRTHEGDKLKYIAVSTATQLPVEVPRTTAEQLEQDLAVVIHD